MEKKLKGYPSIDLPRQSAKEKLSILIQKPIKTPNQNLYKFVVRRPRFNACNIVCKCYDQELSFYQLQMEAERHAKAFAGIGVKKGDIVPICTEPSIEAVIAFFALNRLGAVSTFLNNTASMDEIANYVNLYDSKLLLVSAQCAQRLDKDELKKHCCMQDMYILSSESAENSSDVSLFSEQLANYADIQVELDVCGKDAPAHISYTSGTTGLPKAILLSNENIMAEVLALRKATKLMLGPKGNTLQVVPFNYPYGFITTVLLHIYSGKTPALTPSLTLKNIHEYLEMYKPCYINGIPSFYKRFIHDPLIQKMDLSFIKYPITGGDTLDSHLANEINNFFRAHGSKGKISNGYGNGEASGAILSPASVLRSPSPGSCGWPIPGLSVKLIDSETGKPVPVGHSGRFCFSGTNVMMEYYRDAEATEQVFHYDEDGRKWFYTDTYMHMDEKNCMFMDGRERRFFITFDETGSAYKVYCDYVQKVIAESIPEITDCAVVQREDETRSLVPVAFVSLKNPEKWNAQFANELRSRCQHKLQNCAVPTEFIPIEELPLTHAGKVDYRVLERKAQKEVEG
ncbi:MAG: acyl--CoA ligase [Clostridia bacterium]|nr:acyl--CoA ligase [Clostridia bacterium]